MSNIHSVSGFAPMAMDAASMSSGMAFLNGELEKRDPRLLEPLTAVTWMRDIVALTGGGYVDFTSNYFVDYATSGANQYGIINNATTVIPIIQANISKDVFPVFTWSNIIRVPFLDEQKLRQIGRSLDQIYDEGLRLNYNKTLDQNVYLGFSQNGTYGLVNNPNVTSSLAVAGASTSRLWSQKTPQEIMNDVNTAILNAWATSQYDLTGIPNQILIPPVNFTFINNQIVSSAGNISTLEYLKRYNLAAAQGVELEIFPCRQTIGVGLPLTTGGAATNRMVAYVNREDRVCYDLPVPLTRAMTQPNVEQMSYLTAYVGQIGVVKFKYYQCVNYTDGI